MQEFKFNVAEAQNNSRLDRYIVAELKNKISRVFIQRLIESGNVLLNGKIVKPHHKIKTDDAIYIKIPPQEEFTLESQPIPLDIVFEDDDVIVVNKPYGMVVHPAVGNLSGTLVNALLNHTKSLSCVDKNRPGIVHRLDKDTSGLLVVAKNNESHLNLVQQFQKHTVERIYLTLVVGRVEFDDGIIDVPLAKDKADFRKVKVAFVNGRIAETKYHVIKRTDKYSALEIYPRTGRTHQIRVHLAFIGHPILGDLKYGKPQNLINRLALHALSLGFTHPRTKEFLRFSSSVPEEFQKFIK